MAVNAGKTIYPGQCDEIAVAVVARSTGVRNTRAFHPHQHG
jgi:hypothetical protein